MGKEESNGGKNYTGYDDRFSTYVWNSETRQFFGRTGLAWAKLTIFYTIFYIGLAAFAGLCYFLFSKTLTEEHPRWMLGYRPMPDPDTNAGSTLIWYTLGKRSDAKFWYRQLDEYVTGVEQSVYNSDVLSCERDMKATNEKSCRVEVSQFGNVCTKANKFGYESGDPCILLKLNRIFGWEPECYGINENGQYDKKLLDDDLNEAEGMPSSLKTYIFSNVNSISDDAKRANFLSTIWITCNGEAKPDQENLGTFAYFPSNRQGISGKYFPYHKQPGYQSPFIFVQLKNPMRDVLINVECKAWAKNIIHDRINRLGSVRFEILIDS
ncbi:Sodium/potassium-transporting ATPase subunit beta-2 [Folsomia candida]|uniref:Sodium/potassium-transporting ATPase subunit beta-2 n=1 Tax=Folsomia candida TaxID=158441 RepID=A0A226E369_FOLCA|nr:Sodium/potassium-transporting ATPase subunit beta-2 [Folsomia candida]